MQASKNLARRLERLEDSLLPPGEQPIELVFVAVDGDGKATGEVLRPWAGNSMCVSVSCYGRLVSASQTWRNSTCRRTLCSNGTLARASGLPGATMDER